MDKGLVDLKSDNTRITFSCNCGKILRVPEIHAGKRAKCPTCAALVKVPDALERAKREIEVQSAKEETPGAALLTASGNDNRHEGSEGASEEPLQAGSNRYRALCTLSTATPRQSVRTEGGRFYTTATCLIYESYTVHLREQLLLSKIAVLSVGYVRGFRAMYVVIVCALGAVGLILAFAGDRYGSLALALGGLAASFLGLFALHRPESTVLTVKGGGHQFVVHASLDKREDFNEFADHLIGLATRRNAQKRSKPDGASAVSGQMN